ncbi:sensor domain-containing diguanylate cyclase [Neobacillus sp. PS3-40]|uniref:sensor domain-containing diguanylate cyclase n=1 Tax=Neobacillus sp. PS3-40 TaxID=3070679 RepID=UPI0027DFA004|nr:sensor domain-containing diguanylate cyclase [Neobacillus sp. PS3-40]WML45672.1 sensor domain-containing diguanylate cyclase [Neobacillus sp. PS3-40]
MEILKRNLIEQLKDCFLDLIDAETDSFRFELFITESLLSVLSAFQVESVSLFMYNNVEQQFSKKGEVNAEGKLTVGPSFISLRNYESLVRNKDIYRKSHQSCELEQYDFLISLRKRNEMLGFIAIKDKESSLISRIKDDQFRQIGNEYATLIEKAQKVFGIVREENKYKQLFRVTEKFHSSMNMDALLGEIILTLQEVYPAFSYYLLLSNDNHSHIELPIKDLEYDSENITALQAYVTGTIQFEDSILGNRSILYAPLKGKQGVYGVLQVIAPDTLVFPKNEVEFITLLAHTAGSALENAQLYQQSKKLVSDLQLINETSHCLNSNLRLAETITYMTEQIKRSFDAQEVGFFLHFPNQDSATVLPGSTEFFFSKEARPYIDYLKNKIEIEKDSLFIGDLHLPKLADNMMGFRSVMAIPMEQSENLKGFAIALHKEAYFFSFETFKLLQSLIHHSTLAFTNSMLREELEKVIITDHLTKLHSRNYLDEVIQRSMLGDEQGAFILIDIDNFKVINDTYGHQIGDEVLIQVANLIKDNIREDDVGARWGGEELAIYLPKVSIKVGVSIAERLVEKVAMYSDPHVTVSCGVSYWKKERLDMYKYLFKRADEALYIAKSTGKNKVVTQEVSKIIS